MSYPRGQKPRAALRTSRAKTLKPAARLDTITPSEFTIDVRTSGVPQARADNSAQGGRHDTDKCKEFKEFVAQEAILRLRELGCGPGPWLDYWEVEVVFYYARKSSLHPYPMNADSDNLGKGTIDALENIIWKNDLRTVDHIFRRRWSDQNRDHVAIRIKRIALAIERRVKRRKTI